MILSTQSDTLFSPQFPSSGRSVNNLLIAHVMALIHGIMKITCLARPNCEMNMWYMSDVFLEGHIFVCILLSAIGSREET